MPKLLCAAAFALALTSAHVALAQPNDSELADRLFREGALALKNGDLSVACSRLEQSNELDAAIGTLGLLALCHERQGRIASAVVEYRKVSSLARSANQPERAALAAERVKALTPHISFLALTLPSNQRDLVISVDDRRLTPTELSAPLPLDPGEVTVHASAVHFDPWSKRVRIAPDGATTRIEIPELEETQPEEPPPASAPVSPPIVKPTPLPPTPRSTSSAPSATTWLAWSVGAAGLATGSVFGLRALSANSHAEPHCSGNDCDASGVELRDSALQRARVSTVAFAIGGVATAFSVFWYVAHDRGAPSLAAGVTPLRDGSALTVSGRF